MFDVLKDAKGEYRRIEGPHALMSGHCTHHEHESQIASQLLRSDVTITKMTHWLVIPFSAIDQRREAQACRFTFSLWAFGGPQPELASFRDARLFGSKTFELLETAEFVHGDVPMCLQKVSWSNLQWSGHTVSLRLSYFSSIVWWQWHHFQPEEHNLQQNNTSICMSSSTIWCSGVWEVKRPPQPGVKISSMLCSGARFSSCVDFILSHFNSMTFSSTSLSLAIQARQSDHYVSLMWACSEQQAIASS